MVLWHEPDFPCILDWCRRSVKNTLYLGKGWPAGNENLLLWMRKHVQGICLPKLFYPKIIFENVRKVNCIHPNVPLNVAHFPNLDEIAVKLRNPALSRHWLDTDCWGKMTECDVTVDQSAIHTNWLADAPFRILAGLNDLIPGFHVENLKFVVCDSLFCETDTVACVSASLH